MSDSLLTLLEIMDQVVQEEEAGASGGGAPTEQELWDAISPFLKTEAGKYYKTRVGESGKLLSPPKDPKQIQSTKDALNRLMVFINNNGNAGPESFNYGFGLLNYLLKDNKEGAASIVEKIAKWILKLNKYYLENPKDQKVSEYIFSYLHKAELVPRDSAQHSNKYLLKALHEYFQQNTTFNLIYKGDNNYLGLNNFLEALKKGRGIVSGKDVFSPTQTDNPASISDSIVILDDEDYEEAYRRIKKGDYEVLVSFLKTVLNKNSSDYIKQIHKEKTSNMLSKAMEHILKDYKKSKDLIAFFKSKERMINNLNANPAKIYWRTIRDKFKEEFNKKYKSYQDSVKSSESGKTFTNPRLSPVIIGNQKDFELVIDNFFGNVPSSDLVGRINTLTEKMQIFQLNGEDLQQKINEIGTREFMNRVLMMEYFIKMSKGFTAGSAGLLFEYFLAMVVGGDVVGHRKDAVDFEFKKNRTKHLGSAKLVGQISNLALKQSVKSFETHKDKEITYVIGIKLLSEKHFSEKTPLDIEKIDIYLLKVKFEGKQSKEKGYKINIINGDTEQEREDLWHQGKEQEVGEKGYFSFAKVVNAMKPVGTMQIMTTTEERIQGFRQRVQKAVSGDAKEILNYVSKLFDNIREADEKSRTYTSTGKTKDGNAALQALTAAQTNLRQIGDYDFKDKKDEYDKLPKPDNS